MPAEVAVALFAKAPRPGRAKTRLAAALGAEGAARLYAAFLGDMVARLREAGVALELWAAAEEDRALLAPLGVSIAIQPPGHLGERMSAALASLLVRHERALILGSDAPTVPLSRVAAAAAALDEHDVVLGPAVDGGYYLIGARGTAPDLGDAVRWSTGDALADTERAVRAGGRRLARVRPWFDVDTPRDLALLRLHLALRPALAPATAAALAALEHSPTAF